MGRAGATTADPILPVAPVTTRLPLSLVMAPS
jgi:hypothetical protein